MSKLFPSITIKQVAQEAGVSIQTVSRVVNNRYDVAPETRQRVQEAITRLGYQPNAMARGLASRRSRTLGLITQDFNDPFFTQVTTGAEQEAHEHGYFFMLGSVCCEKEEEPKYLRLLTERHVEGVLLIRGGGFDDADHLLKLQGHGVPVVTTGFYLPGAPFTVIDVDNIDGGWQATRHLIDNGHRQIATITGPKNWKSAQDRLQGYCKALAEAGIDYNETLLGEGSWHHRSGYGAIQAILSRNLAFSAIFAQNDRMAIGAIQAFRQHGLQVPENISVIGYDDLPEAEFASPALSTLRQPAVEIGQAATRELIHLIESPEAPPRQLLYNAELIVRNSVLPYRSM